MGPRPQLKVALLLLFVPLWVLPKTKALRATAFSGWDPKPRSKQRPQYDYVFAGKTSLGNGSYGSCGGKRSPVAPIDHHRVCARFPRLVFPAKT